MSLKSYLREKAIQYQYIHNIKVQNILNKDTLSV